MSTVFLIGAGASYGSGPCTPHQPPLGNYFFDEFKKMGGIASTVSEELENLFKEDFEKGMDAFFEERNTDVSSFLRDMAKYFSQFEPLDGNLYAELIKIVGHGRKKATFVTTNYDLLIELAAMQQGMLVSYGGLPAPANNLPIIKIHGSCNFFPDMGGGSISGVGFDISGSSGASILDAGIKVARSTREILRFCEEEDAIAPALAMYSPDKRVLYCRTFVEQQQAMWRSEVAKAKRVYIIGLKVHAVDDHIWGVLASSSCKKYYVGGEPQEFKEWARVTGAKNCFSIASTFEESLPVIANHLNSKWTTSNA
ncbi:hypothetical protein [Zhongshania sp.]|uniref:hypothetical protein n=1 Tax=Zhongshania sp. TaxID=1971902 RepID=UPI001B76CD58|nr:hypothetical protein [Zhongshania sp.]MBQ0797353.1 hypothetical protein [Zhongshania sp.]